MKEIKNRIINLNFSAGAACLLILAASSAIAQSQAEDKMLLDMFHKYGITKCDRVILDQSRLQSNWSFFIAKHHSDLHKQVKEVSGVVIYGSKNDTVKKDVSIIETPGGCFYHSRVTITMPGTCKENIDDANWFVSKNMSDTDYVLYKNAGGSEMYAKEVSVGKFKTCVQESSSRNAVMF